jgi:hypothetical protein
MGQEIAMPFSEPLSGLFAEGLAVFFEGTATKGYINLPDADQSIPGYTPGVVAGEYRLLFETSTLPAIKPGFLITVDTKVYRILAVRALDDGKISEAELGRI